MRTKANIEEEIAALATEVRELARRRGTGLPDVGTLVGFILAAFDHQRGEEVAMAVDSQGAAAIGEAVGELQIAPAAEALRACVVTVFRAIGRGDFPAYKRDSQALREALVALLEARAPKWQHLHAGRELYPASWRSTVDPVEHVRSAVATLTRWQVLVWAGQALACAAQDVWLWRLWQSGWREYQEDSRRRGQAGMTEEAWQREVAQHTLPEGEALIVAGWPVPPDADWPEGNEKARLPQVRKWQAEQGALDAALDMSAEGSSAQ